MDKEYVWYACYGSNLSADRFKCYIEGGVCAENGKSYSGCQNDKSLWIGSEIRRFPGKVFFANNSGSWYGKGVAFFDPDAEGETIMRLYKITKEQFDEVQDQECDRPNWYGRKFSLGKNNDGCEILTITNAIPISRNTPSDQYLSLIRKALTTECGISDFEARDYLLKCLDD